MEFDSKLKRLKKTKRGLRFLLLSYLRENFVNGIKYKESFWCGKTQYSEVPQSLYRMLVFYFCYTLIVYKSSNMENGGRYAQNMVLGR
jgi:hypothetical protein